MMKQTLKAALISFVVMSLALVICSGVRAEGISKEELQKMSPSLRSSFLALPAEEQARLSQELATIRAAIEKKGALWTAEYNPISIMSEEKKDNLCGVIMGEEEIKRDKEVLENRKANLIKNPRLLTEDELPDFFDWGNAHGQNYITSVRNQGQCGSCWAFGSVAALEGTINTYFNDPNANLDLSEQDLISCAVPCDPGTTPEDPTDDSGGCHGASGSEMVDIFTDYYPATGITIEDCFSYTAVDNCGCNYDECGFTPTLCSDKCSWWQNATWKTQSYKQSFITMTINDFKKVLIENGPLEVTLYVYNDFDWYTGGIYQHTVDTGRGSHAVLLVGYGVYDGKTYWICKNSWGDNWGEDGYFRIFEGDAGIDSWFIGAVEPIPYGSKERLCTDNDGDDYCNWGIGEKPATGCPVCNSTIMDCDDSNGSIHEGCGMSTEPTGILSVTSLPSDVEVYIKDPDPYADRFIYRGNTPLVTVLNIGTREVRVRNNSGYLNYEGFVNIVEDEVTNLDIVFQIDDQIPPTIQGPYYGGQLIDGKTFSGDEDIEIWWLHSDNEGGSGIDLDTVKFEWKLSYYVNYVLNTLDENGGSAIFPAANLTEGHIWIIDIRVSLKDKAGWYQEALATFTVDKSTVECSITVTSPGAGDDWVIGSTRSIKWTSSGAGSNVKIELRRYYCVPYWRTIISSTENDGSYQWTVQGPTENSAIIRICSIDNPDCCSESPSFDIVMPTITVTSPSSGEDWEIGNTETIEWISSGVDSDVNVKIQVCRPSACGSSCSTITNSTSNDGSYPWTVEGPAKNNCIIRITTLDNNPNVSDESGLFNIVTSTYYFISGRVTYNGSGLPGVNVSLTNAPVDDQTITTDSNGNYQFTDLPNGNYTITPWVVGGSYSFEPESYALTINNGNIIAANFTATTSSTTSSTTTILPQPELYYSPSSFSFSAQQGGPAPSSKAFSIRNDGDGTLNWSLTENVSWLELSSKSGSTTDEIDIVTVSVDPEGLSVGTHSTTISISSNGGSGFIPVSFTIVLELPDDTDPTLQGPYYIGTYNPIDGQTLSDDTGIQWYYTDEGSGIDLDTVKCEYKLSTDPPSSYSDAWLTSKEEIRASAVFPGKSLSNGSYDIRISVKDNAGNYEENVVTVYVSHQIPDPPSAITINITYETDEDDSDGDTGTYVAEVNASWDSVAGSTQYRYKFGSSDSWKYTSGTSTPSGKIYWWYKQNYFYVQAGNSQEWSDSATKSYTVDISNVHLDFWKDSVTVGIGATLEINGIVQPLDGSKPGSYITKVRYQWFGLDIGEHVYPPDPFFPREHWYLLLLDYTVTLTGYDNYGRWRKIQKTISVE